MVHSAGFIVHGAERDIGDLVHIELMNFVKIE